MKAKNEISVHFCPKCRSAEVGYVFRFRNLYGMLPWMECKKCKFKARVFPLAVIDKKKLEAKK